MILSYYLTIRLLRIKLVHLISRTKIGKKKLKRIRNISNTSLLLYDIESILVLARKNLKGSSVIR